MSVSTTIPASENTAERWENEGGPTGSSAMSPAEGAHFALKQYGITPVQLTVFDWGGYRYSNLRDAIAAAKRSSRSSEDRPVLR